MDGISMLSVIRPPKFFFVLNPYCHSLCRWFTHMAACITTQDSIEADVQNQFTLSPRRNVINTYAQNCGWKVGRKSTTGSSENKPRVCIV